MASSKSSSYIWNQQHEPFGDKYITSHYRSKDEKGRFYTLSDLTANGTRKGSSGQAWRGFDPASKGNHWKYKTEKLDELDASGRIYWPKKEGGWPRYIRYLDEVKGVPTQDVWGDIDPINAQAQERLGYPTQKPIALLERIIQTSSNEGDMVLDPFCGCGTAVVAAQKLNRKWIGVDITHLSISLMKYRLKDSFGLVDRKDYNVIGEPEDVSSAHQLAKDDRYQFQWWALSLVDAKPIGGDGGKEGRKGTDKGIDGVINFIDEANKVQRVLVQVKSGNIKSGDIRDLRGTVEREGAAIGIFITLDKPSKDMLTEAVSAGYYHSELWQKDYPKVQILTIEDLLDNKSIEIPPSAHGTFKQSERIKKKDDTSQLGLL